MLNEKETTAQAGTKPRSRKQTPKNAGIFPVNCAVKTTASKPEPLAELLNFKTASDWYATIDDVIKSLILNSADHVVFSPSDKDNIHALYYLKEVFAQTAAKQPETQLQTAV